MACKEYIIEEIQKRDTNKWFTQTDHDMLTRFSTEKEFLALIQTDDEKINSIIQSVKSSGGSVKQKQCLGYFLLEKYGTLRAAAAAAFNTTEQEMFADIEYFAPTGL